MAAGQLSSILRRLLLVVDRPAEDQGDRQLLEGFLTRKDEAAFAALMERHGRLVFGVCRSVLHHEQDAEEAFQATFLVLARMASAIRKAAEGCSPAGSMGWRARTALKARQAMKTRRRYEQQVGTRTPAQPAAEASLRELHAIICEEIGQLADKYRAPFVLCCLEGKTREEAAQILRCKEGTVSSRIAHARAFLEARLARRGFVPATLTAAALSSTIVSAAMPTGLTSPVVQAATLFAAGNAAATVSLAVVTLAEGVIRSLGMAKMKLLLGMVLTLAAWVDWRGRAGIFCLGIPGRQFGNRGGACPTSFAGGRSRPATGGRRWPGGAAATGCYRPSRHHTLSPG